MKSITNFINEHHDVLGHELHIGDFIQFATSGFTVYGQIQEITDGDKPKYIVKSLGWLGSSELREKVKPEYKVNVTSKSIAQINLNPVAVEKLKKDGIIK